MVKPIHVVIAGSDCALGAALSAGYRDKRAKVTDIALDGVAPQQLVFIDNGPVDLAIFVDSFSPPSHRSSELRRRDFTAGIDRLAYGWVVDFVLFHVSGANWRFDWYVFNLADVAIVAGVAGLLYESIVPGRAVKAP